MFNRCCSRRNMGFDPGMNMEGGCPIMEPQVTNCVEKDFYHEVEHVSPFM